MRFAKSYLVAIVVLAFVGCAIKKVSNVKQPFTYRSSYIIPKAELLSTSEIDSGKYFLFAYEVKSGRIGTPHSFYSKGVYLKLDSLDIFKTGDSFVLPGDRFLARAYSSNYRCFVCRVDSIYGQVNVVNAMADSVTLALKIMNGESHVFVNDTATFKVNKDFFKNYFKDYQGDYDNLRIALKEPLKVRKLELFGHKLTYGLDSLPESFGEMRNLEELDLSLLDLEKLPDSFVNLQKLRKLDLSYNNFNEFPKQVLMLKNLEELNLKLSDIKEIPGEFGELKKLRILILDDNKFNSFPMAITQLSNLEQLSISSASIPSIPTEIKNLQLLRRLDLSSFWSYKGKNTISDVSALGQLPLLESLDLEWNKIEQLPENFCKLKRLKKLNLLNNSLKQYPSF